MFGLENVLVRSADYDPYLRIQQIHGIFHPAGIKKETAQ